MLKLEGRWLGGNSLNVARNLATMGGPNRVGAGLARIQTHAMDGRFFWVVVIGAHAEGAAGNPDHVPGQLIVRWSLIAPNVGLWHGKVGVRG